MKKLSLLLLSGILATGVHAQQNHPLSIVLKGGVAADQGRNMSSARASIRTQPTPAARGTATPFINEDFSSGTRTTLPTGWTTGGSAAGGWHWTNSVPTSQYSAVMGTLNSTTKANGWMIFDSDSIGSVTGTPTVFEGTLTSPSYSTTGHSSILLQFQSYYRKLQDSCFVEVSTDNFATLVSYPVNENNTLGGNDFTTNPAVIRMNISNSAANKAAVKIRFKYRNNYPGGTYAWLIDDVSISEIDPVEVSLQSGVFALESVNTGLSQFTVFSALPLQFASPLQPFAIITNNGLNAQANIPVSAEIFRNGTSVYNQTATYANLPVNGSDSIVEYTGTASAYTPTATGTYNAVFKSNQPADGYATNDVDSFSFNITDTVFSTYGNNIIGGYYLHAPTSATGGERSFFFGTRYDIPAGKSDTLTAVGVSFDNSTTAGQKVTLDIYKLNADATAWDLWGQCNPKTLTTNDISSTTAIRFASFIPVGNTINNALIMDEGTYAAVAATDGAAPTATVTINATDDIFDQTNIIYTSGQVADAFNDGQPLFNGGGVATGVRGVIPVIRLQFGKRSTVGIGNIPGVKIGKVYPNPANNTVAIPVTTKENASVSVTLSNTVGQTLATQNMGQLSANQTKNATFSTSALANGIYFLTVEANGARSTSRFVVAH